MDDLTLFAIAQADWGDDMNQNFVTLMEALRGLQEIGPLDVVAGSTFPDYYTKDEVNEIIAGANFSFFLSDTVDAVIGAYFQLFDADTGEIKSSVGPITIVADGTTIKTFITEIGQPTFTVLSEGVLSLDIHALTTVGANVKAAQIQWELWKRTQPGGVETLLVTSEEGPDLTDIETHYTIHGILTEEINLDATDRLVLKVLGNNSGAEPADPDVTISMEGDTATRVSVQTTITAFDERYLQLNGAKPMIDHLNMGGFNIGNVGTVGGVDVSAHSGRHESGGADTIKLDDLSTPDDNVDLNASAARHGLLPKLSNTVTEFLNGQGGWTTPPDTGDKWVDRGDPAAVDFSLANLITDATWRDLDLSDIIPVGTTGVGLKILVIDNLVGMEGLVRTKGNANEVNCLYIRTFIANMTNYAYYPVKADADRLMSYKFSNTTWTYVGIMVLGWWLPV